MPNREKAKNVQNMNISQKRMPGENPVISVDNFEFLTLSTGFSTGVEKWGDIPFG